MSSLARKRGAHQQETGSTAGLLGTVVYQLAVAPSVFRQCHKLALQGLLCQRQVAAQTPFRALQLLALIAEIQAVWTGG